MLNDPTLQSKAQQKQFKIDPLPLPTLSPIRKIKLNEFDFYIKHISDVYEKFHQNRVIGLQAVTEGSPELFRSGIDDGAESFINLLELTSLLQGGPAPNLLPPPPSAAGQSDIMSGSSRSVNSTTSGMTGRTYYPDNRNSRKDAKDVNKSRRANKLLSINAPSIDTVPAIFFQSDFDLENPHTFSIVSENADVLSLNQQKPKHDSSNPSEKNDNDSTSNSILQEKLSHNLDIVEVHLLKEISRRSPSFFAALSTLQALHNETLTCVSQIHEIRKRLSSISKLSAKNGLEVVRLKRRRGNLGILYGGVQLVSDVRKTQPMIQVLLHQGDFVGALDLIDETCRVLRGSETAHLTSTSPISVTETLSKGIKLIRNISMVPKPLDLRGVRGLIHLNGQLSEMTKMIAGLVESDFVSLITNDFKQTLAAIDGNNPFGNMKNISCTPWIEKIYACQQKSNFEHNHDNNNNNKNILPSPLSNGKDDDLKEKLVPLIMGLLRMDRLGIGLQIYRESLRREIKLAIKKV